MVTRGVPCLRRATSLAYTDADEDAERLLSFGDSAAAGNEADEWVETHAGRRANNESDANPRVIDDIPDLDGPHEDDGFSAAAANLSLSETPDLDDIPDMEEDLEDGDDVAAAPSKAPPPRKPSDATFVPTFQCILLCLIFFQEGRRGYEREPTLSANVRCHDHL